MGHGMAKNLVERVTTHDSCHKNRAPIEDLVKRGAVEAGSAKELAEKSDVIFLCVPARRGRSADARQEGIVAGAKKGAIVIDTSTSEPTLTVRSRGARGARHRLLRCPDRAQPKEAEEGPSLGVMMGGDVRVERG